MPNLDLDKVAFIIEKAREFEAPEGALEEDDDQEVYEEAQDKFDADIEELHAGVPDDPAYVEVKNQIDAMNIDEQCELVALAWVGRGDFSKEEWADALKTARQEHNKRTAEYLLGMPLLPDHLQAGLDALELGATI